MEEGKDVAVVEGGSFASYTCQCRICHEEEERSCTSMESPCACSGTVKFAHRGCVQRWCDEKGSTFCEICLQNYEPGYSVASEELLLDIRLTTRGRPEASRQNHEIAIHGEVVSSDETEVGLVECSPESATNLTRCRSIATAFTVLLLFGHMISVFSSGANHQPLALTTVFALRASGILLPFYLVMRTISAIQLMQRQCRRQNQFHVIDGGLLQEGEVEDQMQHHAVQIDS